MIGKLKKNIARPVLFAMSLFLLHAPLNSASATNVIADTPCDNLYYESLSARAWLEAQREITQNQNLILKPDSVFEYTCFDRLARELSYHANSMLSETTAYGTPLGTSSMDNALQQLVGDSLREYINGNFGSKTGVGGGYNMLAGHPAATGISHTIANMTAGSPAASNYSCDIMSRVWHAAKCINFISNATTDGFFTFQEYAASAVDKRHLPTVCSAINTNWTTNLSVALSTGPWTNDPVQTYLDQTVAPSCGSAGCSCSGSPIPTGVQVIRTGYDHNNYEEHVCLQPGCRFDPDTNDCRAQ